MNKQKILEELKELQAFVIVMRQHNVLLSDNNFIPFSKEMNWIVFNNPMGESEHYVILWEDASRMTTRKILLAEEAVLRKAAKGEGKISYIDEGGKRALLKASSLIQTALADKHYCTVKEAFELLEKDYPTLFF